MSDDASKLRNLLEACKAIAAIDDGDEPLVWRYDAEFSALHEAIAKIERPT